MKTKEKIEILDYKKLLNILQNYISKEENIENITLHLDSIEDCIQYIFKDLVEEYYLKVYEKINYNNEKDIPLSLLSNNCYQSKRLRLKNNLSEEEKIEIKLIQNKIFKNISLMDVELFKLSPCCYVHQEIRVNYPYKITTSLIQYYSQYKLLEVVFGSDLKYSLMKKTPLKKYLDYKIMEEKYKEMKKEKWVNYLFVSYPELECFFEENFNVFED
jgi:hypothetical protein